MKSRILEVKQSVARKCNVSIDALSSPARTDLCVVARWIAMTVCCELGLSHEQTAKLFRRERSTVSFAVRETRERATVDRKFSIILNQCRNEFGILGPTT